MNTAFLLMAQFDGLAIIPAETVCAHYFPHLKPDQFLAQAASGKIRLPIVRATDSQKSAKGVHLQDLAQYIDERSNAVLADFNLNAGRLSAPHILDPTQLVTQEFILRLVKHSPNIVGIYFLFCGDECVYVGQSTRLHTRIREHMEGAGKKEFDSYSWFECPAEDLNILEAHCIATMKPRLNANFLKKSGNNEQ